MAQKFIIYYADEIREGSGKRGWNRLPSEGVQVVVMMGRPAVLPDRHATGYTHHPPWDRTFYTGVDEYDPMGWGIKHGSAVPDDRWRAIWDMAVKGVSFADPGF